MRTRQAPCTFSPCHGTDSARIPLCDFPGGARWPPYVFSPPPTRHSLYPRARRCIRPGISGCLCCQHGGLWHPPLVTEGVICSSDAVREARSRPSRRFACALWPEFSLNALKKGSIGWGCRLSGLNPEERAFLVRTRALVFCLARPMACSR